MALWRSTCDGSMAVRRPDFESPPPPPPRGGYFLLLFFYFQTGYYEIDVPFCVRQNSLCLIKNIYIYIYIEPCQYKNIAYHNFALGVSIFYSRLEDTFDSKRAFLKAPENPRGDSLIKMTVVLVKHFPKDTLKGVRNLVEIPRRDTKYKSYCHIFFCSISFDP